MYERICDMLKDIVPSRPVSLSAAIRDKIEIGLSVSMKVRYVEVGLNTGKKLLGGEIVTVTHARLLEVFCKSLIVRQMTRGGSTEILSARLL